MNPGDNYTRILKSWSFNYFEEYIISHMAILSYNLQTSVYLPVCDFLIVESAQQYRVRPSLEIFLFPLTRPCLTGMGRSVGKLFYFTSQTQYTSNLIVNSPTLGNNIKYTNNLQLKIFFKYNAVYIGQFFKLANCQ